MIISLIFITNCSTQEQSLVSPIKKTKESIKATPANTSIPSATVMSVTDDPSLIPSSAFLPPTDYIPSQTVERDSGRFPAWLSVHIDYIGDGVHEFYLLPPNSPLPGGGGTNNPFNDFKKDYWIEYFTDGRSPVTHCDGSSDECIFVITLIQELCSLQNKSFAVVLV